MRKAQRVGHPKLSKHVMPAPPAVTCVADRDYDVVLGRQYDSPFLLFMDHCCMEMYCFNSDVLDGLLRSVAPSFPKDGETVMAGLTPLLHRLFAIRATNIDLQLGLKWLDSFEKSCSIKGHSIEFNEDDFVTRYLGKNAQLETKQRFIQRLGEISAKLKGDRRMFIRGHDFSSVLAWYLREHSSKTSPFFKPQILEQFLIALIDHARLPDSHFFRDLLARVRS